MLVVVARIAPAVQVQIELRDSFFVVMADFPGADFEGDEKIIPLRVFPVIKQGVRGYVGFDALVNDGGADQLIHQGITGGFFRQGGK